MPRSQETIEQSIADSIESINPSIDTQKGPIADIFITPPATQLRISELQVDNLDKLYSINYILTRNTTALELYGSNHGLRKSPGKSAQGNCTFYTYSRLRDGEITVIPAGTVITTSDPSIAYQTRRTAYIYGDRIDTYYNTTTRRYEIQVPIESLGTGDGFEVPAYRIKEIRDTIDGIDGVVNKSRITGSTAAETNAEFGTRIRTKFNGTALGSASGLKQLIQNYDPSLIKDLSLVFSTDFTLFKRYTRRPAWDVYIIGDDYEEETETLYGDNTTTEFQLSNVPVSSVSEVLVNNIPVAYSLEKDTSDQTSESSAATDKIILLSAPSSSDEIVFTYEYDKLPTTIQTYVEEAGRDLYEADILIRKAIAVPLVVSVEIQVLSSFDATQAISDTFAIISEYLNTNAFVTDNILYPENLRTTISGNVGGASQVIITEFRRKETSTLIYDAIELTSVEYPTIADADIFITVK